MTEYGEFCREMREYRREARARRQERNMKKSLDVLAKAGVEYESRNGGYHFIIRTPRGAVNYYPTTEHYNGMATGSGVEQLVKELKALGWRPGVVYAKSPKKSRNKYRELRERLNKVRALVIDAISECRSEEQLGSISGGIYSEAFRTKYLERMLDILGAPAGASQHD